MPTNVPSQFRSTTLVGRQTPVMCFVSLVLCIFGLTNAEAAPEARGKVAATEGTVELFSHAFPDRGWKRVVGGQDLYEGDLLRTGPGDSCAKVTFYSAAGQDTIDIAPDTLLELPIPAEPKSTGDQVTEVLVELKEGLVRWWTGDKRSPDEKWPSAFNIRTPTVVAGGREGGTDGAAPGLRKIRSWELALLQRSGETTVMTREGQVDVTSRKDGSTVQVNAGQKMTANEDGLGTVEPLDEAEWEAAVANMPRTPPEVIVSQESSSMGTYGCTWNWNGSVYVAKWWNGTVSEFSVSSFDGKSIVVSRRDTDGPSKGLTGHYEGTVENNTIKGTCKWTFSGWSTPNREGKWTASW